MRSKEAIQRALARCQSQLKAVDAARCQEPMSDEAWHSRLDAAEARLQAFAYALSWAAGEESDARRLASTETFIFSPSA